MIARFFSWFREKLCCCCDSNDKNLFSKYGITRAPEPSDVYWDNLQFTFFDRAKKIFLTYFASLFIIAGCFGVIYGINVGKGKLNKRDSDGYVD